MRGVLIKLVAAIVLTTLGIYFFTTNDTKVAAQTAPPDYKVGWTATKFLTLDFEKMFYPIGHRNDGTFRPDPAANGAKTRLAIGVQEWRVVYSVKRDGCDQNIPSCYQDKYSETWRTGADTTLPGHQSFASDNCYKVPANCQPGGKYAGEWSWSLGSENLESPNTLWGDRTLRQIVEVGTASVTDTNLYAVNSTIFTNLFPSCDYFNGGITGTCWTGPKGRGPGFLEVYQCVSNFINSSCRPGSGGFISGNLYLGTYFYTSGPYTWQHTYQTMMSGPSEVQGSDMTGTLAPAKWFISGTAV